MAARKGRFFDPHHLTKKLEGTENSLQVKRQIYERGFLHVTNVPEGRKECAINAWALTGVCYDSTSVTCMT